MPLGAEALEPLPGFGRDADRKRNTVHHKDTQQHMERHLGLQHYMEAHSSTMSAKRAIDGLPARDHWGGSDPGTRGKGVRRPVRPCPLSWRISGEKPGVAPTTSTPPVRRATAARWRGTREAQSRFGWSQGTRQVRVVPLPVRRFGEAFDHNGEDSAL